jgi:hypothetical protein
LRMRRAVLIGAGLIAAVFAMLTHAQQATLSFDVTSSRRIEGIGATVDKLAQRLSPVARRPVDVCPKGEERDGMFAAKGARVA